eukprot:7798885-Pyramimonas_sp.AAC.1
MGHELGRRIGAASADFRILRHVWRRSLLSLRWRLAVVFKSLVESKLLYALPAEYFTTAESRILDGFQARCLRKVLNIKPSFLSRVSNASVSQHAGAEAAFVNSDANSRWCLKLYCDSLKALQYGRQLSFQVHWRRQRTATSGMWAVRGKNGSAVSRQTPSG